MTASGQKQEAWFTEAADLARRGRGLVEPNPMVGALALCGDEIVGRGWHALFGGPHAEEAALSDARAKERDVDGLVVTLEPCSTEPGSAPGAEKRRPACTSLILEAGIRRVIVGSLDPDPRHQGAGFEVLREAGIEVQGPCNMPALQGLLDRFMPWIAEAAGGRLAQRRPWVQAKWAMTLDGKTASKTGSSRWISGEAARSHAHRLRAAADAVLVGMGTVLCDDSSLDLRHREPSWGEVDDPVAVVLDPRAEIPMSSRLVARAEHSEVWLLVSDACPQERVRILEEKGVRILACPGVSGSGVSGSVGDLDLVKAMECLRAEGIRRLLVEGGGKLVGKLFDAGLLDQCEAILAPKLIGGGEAPVPIAGTGISLMDEAVLLEDCYSRMLGDCLLFGGYPNFPRGTG